MRVLLWQLTRRRLSWLLCLWDVANAFPSIARCALDQAVHSVSAGDDATLLCARHHNTIVALRDNYNEKMICIAPRQGDLQGDTAAAQKFMIAYDAATEQMLADA
eukprot:3150333-Heterocapsa_arctica.AAC.1